MSELPKTIDTYVLIPEDYVKREWYRLLKEAGYTRKSLDYEEMPGGRLYEITGPAASYDYLQYLLEPIGAGLF